MALTLRFLGQSCCKVNFPHPSFVATGEREEGELFKTGKIWVWGKSEKLENEDGKGMI